MDQLTERLVEYAQTLSYEDLPPEVVERTKRLILDTIGCALGAAPWQAPSVARALAADVQSRTPATVMVGGQQTSPDMAAFANGVMTRYLDYNDYCYTNGSGHPSAESSDLFGHDQVRFTLTAIVGIDPCFQFGGTQQPARFRDGPLAMHPFRFNRVEPRTFARQVADDNAHARGTPLDLLIMVAYPVLHGPAAVPGGVVPDQQQRGEALRGELCRAPGQQIDRHRTHGAPGHKPEPHLIGLQWSRPQQQAITGQRLGIRIVRGPAQLLQLVRGFGVRPAMLVGLGQATPPDFVAKAQSPRGLRHRPLHQLVTPFFFGHTRDRDW